MENGGVVVVVVVAIEIKHIKIDTTQSLDLTV